MPPGAQKTSPNVLIVDDDRHILAIVRQWLSDAGYAVVACDRFEDARRSLTTTPPDVLITDVRLGLFDGVQLVMLAKEQRVDTRAIVMSGFDHPALRMEAAQYGASCLIKPFGRDEALAAIRGPS
jgi:DNA-binding response OmpR family regulator